MNNVVHRKLDMPEGIGLLGQAKARLGRIAIAVATRLRPPTTLGVRLVATNPDGQILLVRQTYMPGLMLPGGGVEPGETCCEAAVREAAEEAGITTSCPPELFHVYLNRSLENRDHVVLFVAKNVRQNCAVTTPLEIVSADFYPLDALPKDVTPATRARIAEVLHGAAPSDEW